MFRILSLTLAALALLTPFTTWGHSIEDDGTTFSQQRGDIKVSITPLSHIYAKRSEIHFEVCGGGVLLQAARQAAELWNRELTGRVQIFVVQSPCADSARIRNDRSELYYSDPGSMIHKAVGLYQAILDRQWAILREEDIIVEGEISERVFLTNIISHEFGHALGLNHAMGAGCRESVMAEYACRGYSTPPTAADVAAAKRIYNKAIQPIGEFDLDNNNFIDDGEFFRALDLWLHGDMSDRTFFALIDAWINARAINPARSERFRLLNARRIELYDLSGVLVGVFTGRSLRNALKSLPAETFIYRAHSNGVVRLGKVTKS